MGACTIGMDDQLLTGFADLSFASFRQWFKYAGNVMVGAEFDPL
jgi:hypothetical protein